MQDAPCATLTRTRGQALVEFALILPIFLALMLGFAELAMLFASRQGYQNGVDVLADWAAISMATSPGESWQSGWGALVADESAQAKCTDVPSVLLPDVTHDPGDRVRIRWDCYYDPKVAPGWGGMTVTVQSEAVVPMPVVIASPSPS